MAGWQSDPDEHFWNKECWDNADASGHLTAECACYVWPLEVMWHAPYCPYCDTGIVRNMRPGWQTARPLQESEKA